MRASGVIILSCILAAVLLGAVPPANASVTVAAFSDPAVDGTTPLFTRIGNTLSGGWSGHPSLSLDLHVPITGQTWPNSTFTMTPLTIGTGGVLSAGTIWFYNAAATLVLRIDFDAATLYAPFGWGASFMAMQDVTFSGPGIPTNLVDEQFAFSFANPVQVPGGITWTASFTSSAIPEPASLMVLATGMALLARRR